MQSDPAYQTALYSQAVKAIALHQEQRWPRVQALYTEPSNGKRRHLYSEITPLDPEIFRLCRAIFTLRHDHALRNGSRSLLEWSRKEDNDLIDWRNILHDATLIETVGDFSKGYADERKKILGLSQFNPWDFWLQNPEEQKQSPHFLMLAENHDQCVVLLENFMRHFGFEDIFTRINWIKNEKQTLARIQLDDSKVKTGIALSETSSQTTIGSLSYLGVIAHELGHILQAQLNQTPTQETLAPPHLLREIISMFLQKLFLCPQHLNEILKQTSSTDVVKKITFEDNETLVRLICYMEFEMRLYDLIANNSMNPEDVSREWKECQKKFFGFEGEIDGEDHSWQGGGYYLVYHPFYNRSYIIGEVLGRVLLRRFLTSLNFSLTAPNTAEVFRDMIIRCSNRGGLNNWEDYMAVSGIPHFNSITLKNEIIRCLIGKA